MFKKYVLKHEKWAKNLAVKGKGCNFALAFGNEGPQRRTGPGAKE